MVNKAMDMMTKVIYSFDPGAYKLDSDESMLYDVPELEKMSGAMDAYKKILLREENKGYLEELKNVPD